MLKRKEKEKEKEKKRSGGSDRKDRGKMPIAFEVTNALHSQIMDRVRDGGYTSIAAYFRDLARHNINSAT